MIDGAGGPRISETNAGQQVGITGCRQKLENPFVAEAPHSNPQAADGGAARQSQCAVVRVDHRQAARSICVEFDLIALDLEHPRLRVMPRRRQNRIAQQEAQLFGITARAGVVADVDMPFGRWVAHAALLLVDESASMILARRRSDEQGDKCGATRASSTPVAHPAPFSSLRFTRRFLLRFQGFTCRPRFLLSFATLS